VWVECDVCAGRRYNPETLAVQYKSKSIADVLNMRISEALELFSNIPKIRQILQTLADVGLDYLALGQSAPTLSGGGGQRVKLAAELARPTPAKPCTSSTKPTTGLHFDDIRKLLDVLNRLVDLGNTVIVVEHNLDVIKTADWSSTWAPMPAMRAAASSWKGRRRRWPLSPLSPPGERAGDEGTAFSHTAKFVAEMLKAGPYAERPKYDPFAAEKKRDGDVPLEKVGKDAAMPWQTDGQTWHTKKSHLRDGKPARWDGAILTWIDDKIHELGDFAPTNWKHHPPSRLPPRQRRSAGFSMPTRAWKWLVRLISASARTPSSMKNSTASSACRP